MRVVITGHRPKKLPGGYDWDSPFNIAIINWMVLTLQGLFDQCQHQGEDLEAATGMALGVDQMFASACHKLSVPFHAFVPCLNQDGVWPRQSQDTYNDLLTKAVSITHTSNSDYWNGCMQVRNEAMRDWALRGESNAVPLLMAVWNGGRGGTKNTVDCCAGKLNLLNLNPEMGEESGGGFVDGGTIVVPFEPKGNQP